ncbi:hypothetical protein [Rhodopseudomonas sp.]|uniref:hypothetical protein n=1 Tax=Rhodopseudomonas sp. TaxID=1078 RepID=UPI003B3A27E2
MSAHEWRHACPTAFGQFKYKHIMSFNVATNCVSAAPVLQIGRARRGTSLARMFGVVLSLVMATFWFVMTVSPASAISAALAKKCQSAALLAFPNQRVGTMSGVEAREKFRRDCVEKNGETVSPASTEASPAK